MPSFPEPSRYVKFLIVVLCSVVLILANSKMLELMLR